MQIPPRIRPPGISLYGLGPYIDAGSVSRRAESTYRSVRALAWEVLTEDLDLYDLTTGEDANQAFFIDNPHSSIPCSFQGRTKLTSPILIEGPLMLYPYIKWAIVCLPLRPFFKPLFGGDVFDSGKWTIDLEISWSPEQPAPIHKGSLHHLIPI